MTDTEMKLIMMYVDSGLWRNTHT